VDSDINNVLQTTRQYSVSGYLLEYPEEREGEGQDYKVGGYDVIRITIYEENDLSREAVRISADGYISFPLIGRLKVNNLTTTEIEKLISQKLAEGQYLLDAHVSVMVTEYNSKSYFVLGAVKSSGSYPLRANENILDAVSRAGGIDFSQSAKSSLIIRTLTKENENGKKIVIKLDLYKLLKEGEQSSNLRLMDKDVLFVPAAERFYIIGQVKSPGSYLIPEKQITLVEAISMAGGFSPIAARNRTRIVRVEDGVEKIIEVAVDAITDSGKKDQDVLINPNDIIVIPESFF
jgi:polysaccharide biosynthesis/export protein